MKKISIIFIFICCFSATAVSSTVNSEFNRIKNSEMNSFSEIEYSTTNLTNLKLSPINISGTEDLRPKYRIGFNAPQIDHRQILLTIDENTSDGFDWGYDAEIYQIFNDDMYWVIDQNKYVIQATNTIFIGKEIPLGIRTVNGGEITIGVDAIENPVDGIRIFLLDKKLNKIYDFKESSYQITLPPGEYQNRYAVVFLSVDANLDDILNENTPPYQDPSIDEIIVNHRFLIYINNGNKTLNIKNGQLLELNKLILYRISGNIVQEWEDNLNLERLSLPINVNKGIYVVKAVTKTGIITKKIIVSR